jgi:type I restriction enzyme, R subunit
MSDKEAAARIKINKLLEAAGWRFFPVGTAPANICLEPCVTIKPSDLDTLGENFEKTINGFIDFLLLDTKGFPLIVLAVC